MSNLATNNVSLRRRTGVLLFENKGENKGQKEAGNREMMEEAKKGEEKKRKGMEGKVSASSSPLPETDTRFGFDRAGEALDVKWRRQFPLPLAPTRE